MPLYVHERLCDSMSITEVHFSAIFYSEMWKSEPGDAVCAIFFDEGSHMLRDA